MKPSLIFVFLITLASCAHRDGSHLHATSPGTQQRSGDIQLDLRTDKSVYRRGQPIQITLITSQTSRVEVHSLDSKGHRTPIWPQSSQSTVTLAAGSKLSLPPANADWKLTAAEPLGINTLVATAKPVQTRPSTSPTAATAPFFQLGSGGWKGMKVEPKTSQSEQAGTAKGGEARWLYQVK